VPIVGFIAVRDRRDRAKVGKAETVSSHLVIRRKAPLYPIPLPLRLAPLTTSLPRHPRVTLRRIGDRPEGRKLTRVISDVGQ
jgi:hypothetical protein